MATKAAAGKRGAAKAKGRKPADKILKKPQADEKGQLTFLAPVKLKVARGTPRHTAVIREIKARAVHLGEHFMTILRLCDELVEKKWYERAGFQTPQDLFERQVPSLSWSTIRRYLTILTAVRRLPAAQREPAMRGLQEVGVTKAAILARVIGADRHGWATWVERAKKMGEEELAQAVADAVERQRSLPGTEPRPPMRQGADAKWLKYTVHSIETWAPDMAKEIEECFEVGRKALGAESYWSVLAAMTQECIQEWRLKAQQVKPASAEGAKKA